ncbi:MAG: metallophosphoesterase family protein [Candidatus Omnitrophota bacterium]
MKIGVISDTHLKGVNTQLIRLYQDYFSDVDMIIHAGDIVSIEIIDFLRQKPLHVVHGNMDNMDIKERFPEKKIVEVGGFRLGLIHEWNSPFGVERKIRSEFNNVHAIIYGHSHRPANHIDKGVIFFNPGAATSFSIGRSGSIGVLDIGQKIKGNIIEL